MTVRLPARPSSDFRFQICLRADRWRAKWKRGMGENGRGKTAAGAHFLFASHLPFSPLCARARTRARGPVPFPSDSDALACPPLRFPPSFLSHLRLRSVFPDNILPGGPTDRPRDGRRPLLSLNAMLPSLPPAFFIEADGSVYAFAFSIVSSSPQLALFLVSARSLTHMFAIAATA